MLSRLLSRIKNRGGKQKLPTNLYLIYLIFCNVHCICIPVYLQTDPKIAYDRIKKRGRSEENGIKMGFLKNLHTLHEDWLINRNSTFGAKIKAKK